MHVVRKRTLHSSRSIPCQQSGLTQAPAVLVVLQADLVVVGSRGMGSFKRSIMGFAGLGSVSDYALHHSKGAAVVVVKATEEQLPAAEPHLAAVAGSEVAAGAAGQQATATHKGTTPKED